MRSVKTKWKLCRCFALAGILWLAVSELVLAQEQVSPDRATVLVVVGAPGEEEFGKQFEEWAAVWQDSANAGNYELETIGLDQAAEGQPTDKEQLHAFLAAEEKAGSTPLWIVLLGHGTFDGKVAKFNMRGPDVSAEECSKWLNPVQRPVAFIDCASSSGPFLNALSATNRVVITATRSGNEQNFARFGRYLSQAVADINADLDKDGQTSLLEAYLMASRLTAEFYESEGRLATEHALMDDTGDSQGTPADWFRGVRVIKESKSGVPPDGFRAHQFHLVPSEMEKLLPPDVREQRDELEMRVFQLRERKEELDEDEYYSQLEALFLEMARMYERVESAKPADFE